MNEPLKVIYGEIDNSHGLLSCSDNSEVLPRELLGLTDKPPGHLASGEIWWPAVGCGPVGNWWAIWWTIPDETSSRGGMVRSNVLLWPIHEIAKVNDLSPYIKEISGLDNLPAVSDELLQATSEGLVATQSKIKIVSNLNEWPNLISKIWKRLWPEAREVFSVKALINPPQSSITDSFPCLVCVPPSCVNQWYSLKPVIIAADNSLSSRASKYLIEGCDDVLDEVLSECAPRKPEISFLTTIARAADRLDTLRKSSTVQSALDLLRTIVFLAPEANTAIKLKKEALQHLRKKLPHSDESKILSLANLDGDALPKKLLPVKELQEWIYRCISGLDLFTVNKLLCRLTDKSAELWWRESITQGVKQFLEMRTPDSYANLLMWLGIEGATKLLTPIIKLGSNDEKAILSIVCNKSMNEESLTNLKMACVGLSWPSLHAWSLIQDISVDDVFEAQRGCMPDYAAGMEYLIGQLPGKVVIKEAITTSNDTFIKRVAKRTSKEPELLIGLNIRSSAGIKLWTEHILIGGCHWPFGSEKNDAELVLIDAILLGNKPIVFAKLAAEIAATVFSHPRRTEIWRHLSAKESKLLSEALVDLYVSNINKGGTYQQPETPYLLAVIEYLGDTDLISPKLLVHCLEWETEFNEKTIIQWIGKTSCSEWQSFSSVLGRIVNDKRWRIVAEHLYNVTFSYKAQKTELKLATIECVHLLGSWQKGVVSLKSFGKPSNEDMCIANRVGEVGANLAYNRLEYIWHKANGDSKHLQISGDSGFRWADAARKAELGALEDGLNTLVRVLLDDFPYNPDLLELKSILEQK